MTFYHDLAETSPDPTGSHRILDGSGKISPDLARSHRVSKNSSESVSHEIDHHPPATRTDESVTATDRLRVEKPSTRTVMGRLRVGQKPDPPDPWTALLMSHKFFFFSFYPAQHSQLIKGLSLLFFSYIF